MSCSRGQVYLPQIPLQNDRLKRFVSLYEVVTYGAVHRQCMVALQSSVNETCGDVIDVAHDRQHVRESLLAAEVVDGTAREVIVHLGVARSVPKVEVSSVWLSLGMLLHPSDVGAVCR